MAVCDVTELLAVDPCLYDLDAFKLQVIKVQMLCNLLDKIENGGEVTCDIDTLLEQGKCFYDLSPFVLLVLEVQLLCEISDAI
jgi:hypothetical protein